MSVNRKCFKGTRHEVLLRHITKDSNWNVECVVQTHSPFKKSPFAGISTDRYISSVRHRINEKTQLFLKSSIMHCFTISGFFGGGKWGDLYRFQRNWGRRILQSYTIPCCTWLIRQQNKSLVSSYDHHGVFVGQTWLYAMEKKSTENLYCGRCFSNMGWNFIRLPGKIDSCNG